MASAGGGALRSRELHRRSSYQRQVPADAFLGSGGHVARSAQRAPVAPASHQSAAAWRKVSAEAALAVWRPDRKRFNGMPPARCSAHRRAGCLYPIKSSSCRAPAG